MAIVSSRSGAYFDVPDEELSKYAKKPEEVGADVAGRSGEGPGAGPGGPGGGGSSPIQIIVNYIQGGGGGMPAPQGSAGAPGEEGKKGTDVGGRYCSWHNCWRNCWKNCWRNSHHHHH